MTETQNPEPDSPPAGGYVRSEDVEAIVARALADRDKQHEADMAAMRAQVPVAMVPANSGGPGNDDHRESWSLAAQEAAQAGRWEEPE